MESFFSPFFWVPQSVYFVGSTDDDDVDDNYDIVDDNDDDYQEDAEEGKLVYPKRFEKIRVRFSLGGLVMQVQDEDLDNARICHLRLERVEIGVRQRPSLTMI